MTLCLLSAAACAGVGNWMDKVGLDRSVVFLYRSRTDFMGFQTASCKVTTGRKCAADRLQDCCAGFALVGCAIERVGCSFAQAGVCRICTG